MRCPREGSEMVGDGNGVMKGRRRKVSYAAGSRKGRGEGKGQRFARERARASRRRVF